MAPTSFQTYDVPPTGFDLRALTIDVSDDACGMRPVAAMFIRVRASERIGRPDKHVLSNPDGGPARSAFKRPRGASDPRWTLSGEPVGAPGFDRYQSLTRSTTNHYWTHTGDKR